MRRARQLQASRDAAISPQGAWTMKLAEMGYAAGRCGSRGSRAEVEGIRRTRNHDVKGGTRQADRGVGQQALRTCRAGLWYWYRRRYLAPAGRCSDATLAWPGAAGTALYPVLRLGVQVLGDRGWVLCAPFRWCFCSHELGSCGRV